MGVEVVFKHFLTRWPWLCELSLLNAVVAIFCPPAAAAAAPDTPTVQPWMYVNVVMESTQAVVPVSRDLLKLQARPHDSASSCCRPVPVLRVCASGLDHSVIDRIGC